MSDSEYVDYIARPEYLLSSDRRTKPGDLISKADELMQAIEPRMAEFLNGLHLKVIHIDGGSVRPLYMMSFPMKSIAESKDTIPFEVKEVFAHNPENFKSEEALERAKWEEALKSAIKKEPQPIYFGQTIDPMSENARFKPESNERKKWTSIASAPVLHLLKRSRPYVGTVVNLTGIEGVFESASDESDWRGTTTFPDGTDHVLNKEVYKLAIAAARTTPEFLKNFTDLGQYWTDNPRRDIYYPGPSIVFIGRRGWTCIKLEPRDRDQLAFHLGVVETVLFVLQATLASFRATRRFVDQVRSRGDEVGLSLNRELAADNFETNANVPEQIHKFTAFIARARLYAPVDDMSVLLRSYLTTHTGIAAVKRIRELLQYDAQMENARRTLMSYEASLQGANQYWTSYSAQMTRKSINRQTFAIAVAIAGLLIAIAAFIWNFSARPQTLTHQSNIFYRK